MYYSNNPPNLIHYNSLAKNVKGANTDSTIEWTSFQRNIPSLNGLVWDAVIFFQRHSKSNRKILLKNT